jgi:regulator of replication initiation timing
VPVRAVVEPTTEERLATTTDALGDLLVELARTREHVEELLKRNAKLERKRASLRTRLAAALVEG